jgi:hypothetical protein
MPFQNKTSPILKCATRVKAQCVALRRALAYNILTSPPYCLAEANAQFHALWAGNAGWGTRKECR